MSAEQENSYRSSYFEQRLAGDIDELRSSMAQMAKALTHLAILEERYQTIHIAQNRHLEKLEAMMNLYQNVHTEQVKIRATLTTTWKAVCVAWAVLGTAVISGGAALIHYAVSLTQ